ncbi:hypothetical protein ABGB19_04255 [Mycobacterium sp. B14F4]|uniref:hypothetical protein n=1 Tax=Mycobacterium sp. B14F4 TaxID=3153565 RepID=UPI00325C5D1C
MLLSAKLAPVFDIPVLEEFWRHADEWNAPNPGAAQDWGDVSVRLDEACQEVGRDPQDIRRSVQLFLHPAQGGQVDEQLAKLPELETLGCRHAVLSFYQPPTAALLQRCAEHIAR